MYGIKWRADDGSMTWPDDREGGMAISLCLVAELLNTTHQPTRCSQTETYPGNRRTQPRTDGGMQRWWEVEAKALLPQELHAKTIWAEPLPCNCSSAKSLEGQKEPSQKKPDTTTLPFPSSFDWISNYCTYPLIDFWMAPSINWLNICEL